MAKIMGKNAPFEIIERKQREGNYITSKEFTELLESIDAQITKEKTDDIIETLNSKIVDLISKTNNFNKISPLTTSISEAELDKIYNDNIGQIDKYVEDLKQISQISKNRLKHHIKSLLLEEKIKYFEFIQNLSSYKNGDNILNLKTLKNKAHANWRSVSFGLNSMNEFIIGKSKALPVNYRDSSFSNSDIGALFGEIKLSSDNIAFRGSISSGLIDKNKYGIITKSKYNMNPDKKKISLNYYLEYEKLTTVPDYKKLRELDNNNGLIGNNFTRICKNKDESVYCIGSSEGIFYSNNGMNWKKSKLLKKKEIVDLAFDYQSGKLFVVFNDNNKKLICGDHITGEIINGLFMNIDNELNGSFITIMDTFAHLSIDPTAYVAIISTSTKIYRYEIGSSVHLSAIINYDSTPIKSAHGYSGSWINSNDPPYSGFNIKLNNDQTIILHYNKSMGSSILTKTIGNASVAQFTFPWKISPIDSITSNNYETILLNNNIFSFHGDISNNISDINPNLPSGVVLDNIYARRTHMGMLLTIAAVSSNSNSCYIITYTYCGDIKNTPVNGVDYYKISNYNEIKSEKYYDNLGFSPKDVFIDKKGNVLISGYNKIHIYNIDIPNSHEKYLDSDSTLPDKKHFFNKNIIITLKNEGNDIVNLDAHFSIILGENFKYISKENFDTNFIEEKTISLINRADLTLEGYGDITTNYDLIKTESIKKERDILISPNFETGKYSSEIIIFPFSSTLYNNILENSSFISRIEKIPADVYLKAIGYIVFNNKIYLIKGVYRNNNNDTVFISLDENNSFLDKEMKENDIDTISISIKRMDLSSKDNKLPAFLSTNGNCFIENSMSVEYSRNSSTNEIEKTIINNEKMEYKDKKFYNPEIYHELDVNPTQNSQIVELMNYGDYDILYHIRQFYKVIKNNKTIHTLYINKNIPNDIHVNYENKKIYFTKIDNYNDNFIIYSINSPEDLLDTDKYIEEIKLEKSNMTFSSFMGFHQISSTSSSLLDNYLMKYNYIEEYDFLLSPHVLKSDSRTGTAINYGNSTLLFVSNYNNEYIVEFENYPSSQPFDDQRLGLIYCDKSGDNLNIYIQYYNITSNNISNPDTLKMKTFIITIHNFITTTNLHIKVDFNNPQVKVYENYVSSGLSAFAISARTPNLESLLFSNIVHCYENIVFGINKDEFVSSISDRKFYPMINIYDGENKLIDNYFLYNSKFQIKNKYSTNPTIEARISPLKDETGNTKDGRFVLLENFNAPEIGTENGKSMIFDLENIPDYYELPLYMDAENLVQSKIKEEKIDGYVQTGLRPYISDNNTISLYQNFSLKRNSEIKFSTTLIKKEYKKFNFPGLVLKSDDNKYNIEGFLDSDQYNRCIKINKSSDITKTLSIKDGIYNYSSSNPHKNNRLENINFRVFLPKK